MFNENIKELTNVVPSLSMMKLSSMINDIYKYNKDRYTLNEVDMQKLFFNYGDKYTLMDKIIMLIFGVVKVDNYIINEEKISKDRIPEKELSDKEKDINVKELVTPVIELYSNVGVVVIGYDYAYVKKPEFTPNIELTDMQKALDDDNNILYDINYPYIYIDNENNVLEIYPVLEYDIDKHIATSKHSFDKYVVDINNSMFKRYYNKKYIMFDEANCNIKDKEEVYKDKDLPHVEGYKFSKIFDKTVTKDNVIKYKLITEYVSDDEDKVFQFVNCNDYSIETVYYQDRFNTYFHEKTYFINMYNDNEENKNNTTQDDNIDDAMNESSTSIDV